MLGSSRYPDWAKKQGLPLDEDSGGKYFTFGFYVEFKLYILPVLRFEFVKGYGQPPRGYVKPSQAKAKYAKKAVKKEDKKIEVKEDEW